MIPIPGYMDLGQLLYFSKYLTVVKMGMAPNSQRCSDT